MICDVATRYSRCTHAELGKNSSEWGLSFGNIRPKQREATDLFDLCSAVFCSTTPPFGADFVASSACNRFASFWGQRAEQSSVLMASNPIVWADGNVAVPKTSDGLLGYLRSKQVSVYPPLSPISCSLSQTFFRVIISVLPWREYSSNPSHAPSLPLPSHFRPQPYTPHTSIVRNRTDCIRDHPYSPVRVRGHVPSVSKRTHAHGYMTFVAVVNAPLRPTPPPPRMHARVFTPSTPPLWSSSRKP